MSSILLWLMPCRLWTNIMMVGMPVRATSAASWRGPEERRYGTAPVSEMASIAEGDQIWGRPLGDRPWHFQCRAYDLSHRWIAAPARDVVDLDVGAWSLEL